MQGLRRPQACGLVARRPRLGLRQRHGPAPAPLPAPPPGTAAGGSPGPGAVQGLLPGLLPLPPAVAELQLGLPGWGAPGHPPLGLLHPVSTMGQGWKRCSPTSRSDPSIGPFLVFYPRWRLPGSELRQGASWNPPTQTLYWPRHRGHPTEGQPQVVVVSKSLYGNLKGWSWAMWFKTPGQLCATLAAKFAGERVFQLHT